MLSNVCFPKFKCRLLVVSDTRRVRAGSLVASLDVVVFVVGREQAVRSSGRNTIPLPELRSACSGLLACSAYSSDAAPRPIVDCAEFGVVWHSGLSASRSRAVGRFNLWITRWIQNHRETKMSSSPKSISPPQWCW